MQIKRVNQNCSNLLKRIDVDPRGVEIMAQKAEVLTFHITDIRCGAANILKQDALSVGAEFALPYGTIECKNRYPEGVLIGSKRVLNTLAKKLHAQPYGLKDLGKKIQMFCQIKPKKRQLMAVLNANSDSFYPQSRFDNSSAQAVIQKLIDQGADIIDIGAVSSRPGSSFCSQKEELERIGAILQLIKKHKLYTQCKFSIDSFNEAVVKQALDSGFCIINDITGLKNGALAQLAKSYDAKLCIMHMQNDPQTMQNDPTYEDVTLEISDFFAKQIEKAKGYGLKQSDIILDVGIGFGKTARHNLELIANMEHFCQFGSEILVGASRKSVIDAIFKSGVEDRLAGTLALHMKAYENGANIIRVHDLYEHKQAFAMVDALRF